MPEDAHAQGQLTRPPNQCPRTHIHKRKCNDLQTNAGASSCPQGQGNDLRTRAPGRSCAKKTETTVKTISEDAHAQTERKPYRGPYRQHKRLPNQCPRTLLHKEDRTTSKPMPEDAPAQRTLKPPPNQCPRTLTHKRKGKGPPNQCLKIFMRKRFPNDLPNQGCQRALMRKRSPGKDWQHCPQAQPPRWGAMSCQFPVRDCKHSQIINAKANLYAKTKSCFVYFCFHRTFIPGESRWHGWNWHLTLPKQKRLCSPATVKIGESARPWHFSQKPTFSGLTLEVHIGLCAVQQPPLPGPIRSLPVKEKVVGPAPWCLPSPLGTSLECGYLRIISTSFCRLSPLCLEVFQDL